MEQETCRWRVEHDQYGQNMCLQNALINGRTYRR